MDSLKTKTMTPENDPEGIRRAVQKLSFAYRRSAKIVDKAETEDSTDAEGCDEISAGAESELEDAVEIDQEAESDQDAGPETALAEEIEIDLADTQSPDASMTLVGETMSLQETAPIDADALMSDALRRAEAILFAAGQPLSAQQVAEVLPQGVDAPEILMGLKAAYENRGVHLVEVAGRWRFQTAQDLSFLFVEERHEQKKLSQAALETLAIIAYGQPVTRAEIEAVRGVAVSKTTIDTLMETGWIRYKGRRKTPGRPVTLGTTDAFLEHFGLESLDVLPGKADLEAEGLLTDVLPEDFEATGIEQQEVVEETDEGLEDMADETAFIMDFMDEDEDTEIVEEE